MALRLLDTIAVSLLVLVVVGMAVIRQHRRIQILALQHRFFTQTVFGHVHVLLGLGHGDVVRVLRIRCYTGYERSSEYGGTWEEARVVAEELYSCSIRRSPKIHACLQAIRMGCVKEQN